MTPDEIKKKIDDLHRRHDNVTKKKAALGGQLQAKKEELAALIKDIKSAGYDPKNLPAELEKARSEVEAMIAATEKDLSTVETALSSYEKK